MRSCNPASALCRASSYARFEFVHADIMRTAPLPNVAQRIARARHYIRSRQEIRQRQQSPFEQKQRCKMKKLIQILIAATIAAALVPSSAFAAQPTQQLTVSGESTQEAASSTAETTIGSMTQIQGTITDGPSLGNDELFAGYVDGIFDDESTTQAQQTSPVLSAIQMAACSIRDTLKSRETLSAHDQVIYDALLANIEQVASGRTTNTVFEVSLKPFVDKGLLQSAYSVDVFGEDPGWFLEMAVGDFSSTFDALLQDCPYELYWFDKTYGVHYGVNVKTAWNGSGRYYDTASCSLLFAFAVSADYAETHAPGTVTTTKELSKVRTAAKNASALIARNASKDDLGKLDAYRAAICDMVSYDYDALDPDREYGDPWQLIYAFDGDPATNVVCEGYSKAFKYLCDNSTFDNPSVVCYAAFGLMDKGRHMWNVVSINGYSYLVDITNCDNGSVGCEFYTDRNGVLATRPGKGLFMRGSDTVAYYAGYDCVYTNGFRISIPSESVGGLQLPSQDINYYYDRDCIASLPYNAYRLAEQDYNASNAPACKHNATTTNRTNVVPATCTTGGSYDEVTSCVLCCKELGTKHVTTPAPWHDYKVTDVPATATTGSYKLHTCTRCGCSYKTDISIAKAQVAGLDTKTYTGKALAFKPTIAVSGTMLKLGTDYTVSFYDATGKTVAASALKSAGTYKAVFTGKGTYKDTLVATFKIKPASASKFAVAEIAKQKYTGKAVKPSPTVKFGGKKLKRNTDYTVSYKNNKKKGAATVVIKGKGNFTGTKTVKFKIVGAK